jgi:eukaryotic-like serine/threonine-protein kinase
MLRGGRYETLGTIASGGMASVHLGRALGAGGFERLVAIKTMHPHLASEPEFVAMFLDEARLAARIRHPNVVGTIDVQQDDHGAFLVMEYVEGPSLTGVLRALKKAHREAPISIILRIFLDALGGLHAAHELTDVQGQPLNLVHRDVSPQNILIGVDGIARITDFGVARAEARLTSTHGGQLKGKIGYMSPEQVRRETIDRRTDVYAAGVVLWELLASKRLVQGDSEGEMLAKVMASDYASPRTLNPSVPEALDDACMRALKLSSDDRYATAAEFAEALDEAAHAAGVAVASSRAVATFIKELNAHVSPTDLPGTPLAPPSMPRPSKPMYAAVDVPVSDLTPATRRTSVSGLGPGPSATLASGVVMPHTGPKANPWLTRAFAGIGAVALTAAIAWGLTSGQRKVAGGEGLDERPRTTVGSPGAAPTPAPMPARPVVSATPSASSSSLPAAGAATQSSAAPTASALPGGPLRKPPTNKNSENKGGPGNPTTPIYRPTEL